MTISYNRTYHTEHYDTDPDGDVFAIQPQGILLHDTAGGFQASLDWLIKGSIPPVSCNILIDLDGTVYELADDHTRTWHAGASDGASWYGNNPAAFGILDPNRLIGVELVHVAGTSYPQVQLDSAWHVCKDKQQRYSFARHMIGLHRWLAPARKDDPEDLDDRYWNLFIESLFDTSGTSYRISEPKGARIRQGPGRGFMVAGLLPFEAVFYSSNTLPGEEIAGNAEWIHFSGPTPWNPAPLGFIWSGICEKVK